MKVRGDLIQLCSVAGLPMLLVLLTLPALAQSQFICTTNNGSITITGYAGSGGAVTIPGTINSLPVTSIGNYAFDNCTNWTGVTIPDSVASIGEYVFYHCTKLAVVTIGKSVSSIGYSAFFECTNLTTIAVDVSNASFSSVGGVLFSKDSTILITCPGGESGSYIVPNGVTTIGDFSFFSCANLTSVTIPSSVKFIDNSAFAYCTRLTGIYFMGNAPYVAGSASGGPAFTGDYNLVVYPASGTIGWGATCAGVITWNPLVQNSPAGFGVLTNRFGFNITGNSSLVVVVAASTNLTGSVWSPIATNTLINGSSYFSDPQWTNFPNRFYRIRSP